MITLLDYGAGNVKSVVNAIEKLGRQIKLVSKPLDILNAQKLVFPGVGNYESMIKVLHEKKYINPLREYIKQDQPFLGICLGMQVLFEQSEEDQSNKESLAIFKGMVKRFETKMAVPHIGWNGVNLKQDSPIFKDILADTKFYFVHSYHVVPKDKEIILTSTFYDYEFASSVQKNNIIGTQFHPEKSSKQGIKLLDNFINQKDLRPKRKIDIKGKTLSKRIIACLDVRANDEGDLVVTKGDKYDVREKGNIRNMGKPVELAKRYYEQGADEITFLNITGFRDFVLEDLPMIKVLEHTSKNVFVPLTIGGGIKDYIDKNNKKYTALDIAEKYFRSGADKISIGSDAVDIAKQYLKTGKKTGKSSIEQISKIYGSQAVVISIDPRRIYLNQSIKNTIKTKFLGPNNEEYCWYQCMTQGGRMPTDMEVIQLAKACQELGAGEILLNCIDKDGTNSGFDLELINFVQSHVDIPIIASSGAGKKEDFVEVFEQTSAQAALAAGIFHRNEVSIQSVKKCLANKKIEVTEYG